MTTAAAADSSSPAHNPTMSAAEAATMTPNAARRGIARPRCRESSASQSAVARATAAMASAAAFVNSAKRSWTTAPPK